jgi:lactoylglutathione lyase
MAQAQAEAATKSVVDDIIFRSVGIGVSDLKKSVDFYTRVCGMKQVQTIKLDYMDEVILAYSADGTIAKGSRLVLMHWTDGSKRNYKDNPIKLVLGVPDAKAVADRIRAEGLEIVREPVQSKVSPNIVGFAKDPDGYLIELLQVVKR